MLPGAKKRAIYGVERGKNSAYMKGQQVQTSLYLTQPHITTVTLQLNATAGQSIFIEVSDMFAATPNLRTCRARGHS